MIKKLLLTGLAALVLGCGSNTDPCANVRCKIEQDRVCYEGDCIPIKEHPDYVKEDDISVPEEDTYVNNNPYQLAKFESTNEYCSDGIDNNNNGWVDCKDLGCQWNPYVSVCGQYENTDELCSNGIDDDKEHYSQGYYKMDDCSDGSCFRNPFVTVCEPNETTFDQCTDGIDNDFDGYTDCEDCMCNPFVPECYDKYWCYDFFQD